jgi:hypothetical protein
MASARVIHFGTDDCHRIRVLKSTGYAVEDCPSLRALQEALTASGSPAAIFVSERDGNLQRDAISLAKSCTAAPLVLFRRSNSDPHEESFDLVIDSLTSPVRWLVQVRELIARNEGRNERVDRNLRTARSGSRSALPAYDA